jgi:transposase-like protein
MKNKKDDLTLVQMMARFATEDAARKYFEQMRWPEGVACPHCGNVDSARIYTVTPNPAKKIRAGLYKCAECLDSFTVTVGTVMEDSHIPLQKWLLAFYMMCASKTQVSALQLQRQLELGSYRTAWFMCHRIRFALKSNPTKKFTGTVEVDEMYVGGKTKGKGAAYKGNKTPVISVLKRGGHVRSHVVETANKESIGRIVRDNVSKKAILNTDEAHAYTLPGREFTAHDTVIHSREDYAHKHETGRLVTTNSVEGFFGNAKRSLDGTHHNVSHKYMHLYMAEIDHKYNTREESDGSRTDAGIKGIDGKRLTLKEPVRGLEGNA